MFDPLPILRSAGVPVEQLSTAQRGVLAALTAEETTVLMDVAQRLAAAEDEVVAHGGFKLL